MGSGLTRQSVRSELSDGSALTNETSPDGHEAQADTAKGAHSAGVATASVTGGGGPS